MENKGFYTLLSVYSLLFIGDLVSTMLLPDELIDALEANILYPYGGLTLIIIVNLAVICSFLYLYLRSGYWQIFTRYLIISILILMCFVRIMVIHNNLDVVSNPPTLVEAQSVTQEDKIEAVKKISLSTYMPGLLVILTYLFFRKDHQIKVKE